MKLWKSIYHSKYMYKPDPSSGLAIIGSFKNFNLYLSNLDLKAIGLGWLLLKEILDLMCTMWFSKILPSFWQTCPSFRLGLDSM